MHDVCDIEYVRHYNGYPKDLSVEIDNLLGDWSTVAARVAQNLQAVCHASVNRNCKQPCTANKLQMSQTANPAGLKIRKQYGHLPSGVWAFSHPIKRSVSQRIISIHVVIITIVILKICAQR